MKVPKTRPPPVDSLEQRLNPGELPLELIFRGERERAADPLFTQPCGGGRLKEWTWASAMDEVRRIAAWITAQNYPPQSRIVLLSKNCAWWMMADYAIWMSGHVTVPLFPAVRDASLATLFEHCQPVACFVGSIDHPLPMAEGVFQRLDYISFPNAQPSHVPRRSAAWDAIVASQTPLEGQPQRDADEVATIIYTSGTTGQPKGVMHSFQSLSLMGKSCLPVLLHGASGIDRMLSYLPLAHISERALVEVVSLFAPIHIFFSEGLPTFLDDLRRVRATIFFSIPRLYIRFQQSVLEKLPQKKLDSMLSVPILRGLVRKKILRDLGLEYVRICSSGAAALPVEVIHWYLKLGLNFMEGYGMSETGITHVPLPGQARPGYVGTAVATADTRLSREGEVLIKGPMNLRGYYRNAELTASSFTGDGYFRTGDRGELDGQGRLRLVGRLKEEFKTSKGKYVIPAQIEKLLSLCTLFESVAVFGAGMTGPFALAVLAAEQRAQGPSVEDRAPLEPQLSRELERVNARLEPHEQLRFLVISMQPWTIDNQFLTPTLKVRRSFLEKTYGENFAAWEARQCTIQWLDPA